METVQEDLSRAKTRIMNMYRRVYRRTRL